jgi:transposase-like protein
LDTCGLRRRQKVSKAQQDIRRKTRALEHAARTGNVRQTCRYFGIPRSLFYVWRAAYEREGTAGLMRKFDDGKLVKEKALKVAA